MQAPAPPPITDDAEEESDADLKKRSREAAAADSQASRRPCALVVPASAPRLLQHALNFRARMTSPAQEET